MDAPVRRGPRAPKERLASLRNRNTRLQQRTPAPTPPPRPQTHCPECGSTDTQDVEGTTVCGECGVTISDSNIVAEVTFGENAAGAAIVQGGFVGEGQRHARTSAPGRYIHETREPREISEANGRDEIRRQANRHNLTDNIVDQAVSIYKLALNYNFVQGRQIRIVSAVCLYAACRRDAKNQTLLMDLAEGIAVNVFKLGQTWNDLKKDLYLEDLKHIPVIEVENLIMKFARKLEFGDALMKVAEDAAKLLKRMKRDWMVTGRQPAGLCGACIILAARMNNFRRTVREVVYVVKVTDLTVTTRLEEFGRTISSNMTVDQFRENGLRLRKTHDPPALYKRAELEEKKRKLQQAAATADEEEVGITLATETNTPKTHTGSSATQMVRFASDLENDASPPSLRRSKRQRVDESAGASDNDGNQASTTQRKKLRRDADGFAIPDIPVDPSITEDSAAVDAPNDSSPTSEPAKGKPGRPRKSKAEERPVVVITEDDLLAEEELEKEMEMILNDPGAITVVEDTAHNASTENESRAKALADSLRNPEAIQPIRISNDPEIAEDEFEDDPEVANCLLTEAERRVKERIWVTHNEDWLRARQAKMLKKALDDASGASKKPKKKRKKGRLGDGSVLEGGTPVESAADATRRMLEKHVVNPSKHINYQNVDKLYAELRGRTSSAGSDSATRAGSVAASDVTDMSSIVGTADETAQGHAQAKPTSKGASGFGDSDDDLDDEDEDAEDEGEDTVRRVTRQLGIDIGDMSDAEAGGYTYDDE